MFFKVISFKIILLLCTTDLLHSQEHGMCLVDIAIPMGEPANIFNWPLVLDPIDDEFSNSVVHGYIILNKGDILRLACNGLHNSFRTLGNQIIHVTCRNDTYFEYNGRIYDFYEHFSCLEAPDHTVRPFPSNQHDISNFLIGFQVTNNNFIPLIEVKYNQTSNLVVETKHKIYRGLTAEEKQGIIYKGGFSSFRHPVHNIEYLYSKQSVNNSMDKIIGPEQRQKYFKGQSFIARGHMAAKTDFPFASQQLATYYFLNANPQFQGFNNGNWKLLEDFIRTLEVEGIVTTTIEDSLFLKDHNNIYKTLYLGDNTDRKSVV